MAARPERVQVGPKVCNQCGTRGTCIDTRGMEADGIGYTYRRYECRNPECKHRWTTYEMRQEQA